MICYALRYVIHLEISSICRTLVSSETHVSPDIVDRYHDNVEEVDEQNCQIACKVNVEIVSIEIVLMLLKLMINNWLTMLLLLLIEKRQKVFHILCSYPLCLMIKVKFKKICR